MHTGYTSGLCASNGLTIVEHKTSMCMDMVNCLLVEPEVFSIQNGASCGTLTFKAFETIIKTFADY